MDEWFNIRSLFSSFFHTVDERNPAPPAHLPGKTYISLKYHTRLTICKNILTIHLHMSNSSFDSTIFSLLLSLLQPSLHQIRPFWWRFPSLNSTRSTWSSSSSCSEAAAILAIKSWSFSLVAKRRRNVGPNWPWPFSAAMTFKGSRAPGSLPNTTISGHFHFQTWNHPIQINPLRNTWSYNLPIKNGFFFQHFQHFHSQWSPKSCKLSAVPLEWYARRRKSPKRPNWIQSSKVILVHFNPNFLPMVILVVFGNLLSKFIYFPPKKKQDSGFCAWFLEDPRGWKRDKQFQPAECFRHEVGIHVAGAQLPGFGEVFPQFRGAVCLI